MNNLIRKNLEESQQLLQKINNTDCIEYSQWINKKTNLRYFGKSPNFPIYNNFIYWCNLGINIGSEQNKLRPVIILRSYEKSSISTIIPLTTKRLNDDFWFHIDLEKINSTALIEQTKVISKIRITKPFRNKGEV